MAQTGHQEGADRGLQRAQTASTNKRRCPHLQPTRYHAARVSEDRGHTLRRAPASRRRHPIDEKETRRGNPMNRTFHRIALASLAAAAFAAMSLPTSGAIGMQAALASSNHAVVQFPLVRSAGAVKAKCLPYARGVARIVP